MADSISLQLTPGSKKILDNLARVGKLDLRPTFKILGKGYRKEVGLSFRNTREKVTGAKWQPLSPAYAIQKQIDFPVRSLLVRTGKLLSSITQKGASGNITLIGKNSAVFGSSIPYASIHDEGRGNIPKRNFSVPSDRRFLIWKDQIGRNIKRNFEKEGINVQGSVFA